MSSPFIKFCQKIYERSSKRVREEKEQRRPENEIEEIQKRWEQKKIEWESEAERKTKAIVDVYRLLVPAFTREKIPMTQIIRIQGKRKVDTLRTLLRDHQNIISTAVFCSGSTPTNPWDADLTDGEKYAWTLALVSSMSILKVYKKAERELHKIALDSRSRDMVFYLDQATAEWESRTPREIKEVFDREELEEAARERAEDVHAEVLASGVNQF